MGLRDGKIMTDAKSGIQYFDLVIDGKNPIDEVFPILKILRPGWTTEELCQEKYSEGYMNVMCCFYQKSDTKRQDALVVRLYGMEVGTLLTREKEFLNLQIGHAVGCFPAILATFNNGLVYQYEPGRTMKFKDLNNPETIKRIVRKLDKLKRADVASLSLVNRKGEPVPYDRTPRTYLETGGFIKTIPAEPKDETMKEFFKNFRREISDDYLNREYEYVRDVLEMLKLPMSFSHGDFHPRNMIINDDTGKVTFIDYELSGFHYDGIDMVGMFACRGAFDAMGMKIDETDDKDVFLESRELYAQEYVKVRMGDDGTANEEIFLLEVEMRGLEWRILDIALVFQLLVMMLAFINLDFNKDIDIASVAIFARDEYEKKRGELHSLRDRYLMLKNKIDSGNKGILAITVTS